MDKWHRLHRTRDEGESYFLRGCYGGKGSPPPPPDYAAAATAQGAANKEAAIASAQLSNPNITNPYGSQTVEYRNDPTTGNPVPYITQSLSPTSQQRFNQNARIDTGLGNLAETGLGFVQDTLNTPFNQGDLPVSMVNAGETGQAAIMRRLEPTLQRQREQLDTQLYNRGITQQSAPEAFAGAMEQQNQRENDLLSQAAMYGIDTGQKARQQAIQEQEFFRTEPLNILNAVRSASPVTVPQFQGYQGQNIQAAPIFNAAQAGYNAQLGQYNAQQAGDNAFMQGLFSLGSAAIGAPKGTFSDIRLKSNIKRIGTHALGIGVYEYDIFGRRERGVMAQELLRVKPSAVSQHPSGFLMVDYAQIGGV